jgi:hypothetical protein
VQQWLAGRGPRDADEPPEVVARLHSRRKRALRTESTQNYTFSPWTKQKFFGSFVFGTRNHFRWSIKRHQDYFRFFQLWIILYSRRLCCASDP